MSTASQRRDWFARTPVGAADAPPIPVDPSERATGPSPECKRLTALPDGLDRPDAEIALRISARWGGGLLYPHDRTSCRRIAEPELPDSIRGTLLSARGEMEPQHPRYDPEWPAYDCGYYEVRDGARGPLLGYVIAASTISEPVIEATVIAYSANGHRLYEDDLYDVVAVSAGDAELPIPGG